MSSLKVKQIVMIYFWKEKKNIKDKKLGNSSAIFLVKSQWEVSIEPIW